MPAVDNGECDFIKSRAYDTSQTVITYSSLYKWIMPSVFSTLGLPQKNLMLCGAMLPTECDHSLALPGLLASVDTNSLAPSRVVDCSFTAGLSASIHDAHLCCVELPVDASTSLAVPEAILSWSAFSAQERHISMVTLEKHRFSA